VQDNGIGLRGKVFRTDFRSISTAARARGIRRNRGWVGGLSADRGPPWGTITARSKQAKVRVFGRPARFDNPERMRMTTPHRTNLVLMADDDPDDRLLVKDAMLECKAAVGNAVRCERRGIDGLPAARHQYGDPAKSPRPKLILLDLNMPKKNGCEAVEEIKKNCDLREIPW